MVRAVPPISTETPLAKPVDPSLAWVMAILAASWVVAATIPARSYGDTLFSRLATVYALTHERTFEIAVPGEASTNPFGERTVDKVQMRGRTISSKPPVLPLLMAAEYAGLRFTVGWSLDVPGDLSRITRVMTLSFVGIPFVVLVWMLTRSIQWLGLETVPAAFLSLAAIFGTQAGAYATVFNNHVPAAAAVMVSFYLAIRLLFATSTARPLMFVGFGIATGLAATLDVPVVIFPALLGLALATRYLKSLLVWALLPAVFFIAVQSVALLAGTGSLLPVQMHPETYLFENSHWRNPLGVDALNDPLGMYLFHVTWGRVGIFSLFPITLLAIPGVLRELQRRSASASIAICGAVGAVILIAYYVISTNNYGGSAFGFRWLIVLGPVSLLLGAPALRNFRGDWRWLVLVALLAVSSVSTVQCYQRPWDANREWTTRVFGPSI